MQNINNLVFLRPNGLITTTGENQEPGCSVKRGTWNKLLNIAKTIFVKPVYSVEVRARNREKIWPANKFVLKTEIMINLVCFFIISGYPNCLDVNLGCPLSKVFSR